MIDQLLEGMIIGMTASTKMMWWLYPVVEMFERLMNAVRDVLSRKNIENTEEQSI